MKWGPRAMSAFGPERTFHMSHLMSLSGAKRTCRFAALFAMGLPLVGHRLIGNVGEVIWLAVLKTVVNPILTFALVTYVFTLEPLWSQAAVILSAMPTAANAYVIAQQYNVYFKTVSPAVVISTGMSVVTIFLLLIWFGVR